MAAIPTGKMFTRRSIRIAHVLGPPQPASPITSTTPSLSLLRLAHTQSHTPPPHPRPTLGDCTLLPSTKFRTRPLRLTICPPITTSRHRHYTSSSFTSDPNSPTPPPPSTAPIANALIPAPERTPLKVTNPKKSDAGTDMLISITPRAVDVPSHPSLPHPI
ncbi:hypothetical protein BGX38DRAFT_501102 [Terfezia claveryi]|nr:hypothetical protein BGX38DRAFT_501102 [Terfezia claveryi]